MAGRPASPRSRPAVKQSVTSKESAQSTTSARQVPAPKAKGSRRSGTASTGQLTASRGFTVPLPAATYPLSLVARGEDPNMGSARFMGVMMAVMLLAAYSIVVPLINTGVTWLGWVLQPGGLGWKDYASLAGGFGTPWGIAAAHLALASLTLVVWFFYHTVHRRPMGYLWSVSPGVRWLFAFLCLIGAAVILGATAWYHWVDSNGWNPAAGWGASLTVILVTTPFQALAEEVVFRGYLLQCFGMMVRNEWFPILASAGVFALFHGVQNPWLFISRFAFGVVAGVLVWRTGGLEAGVAIHIMNNVCAFGLAIATGTLMEVKGADAISWVQSLMDVGVFVVCALPCWLIAWRMRVPLRVQD